MSKFIIPLYDVLDSEKKFIGHQVIDAEGIAGLYVHRSHLGAWDDREWRISNVVGLNMYPGAIHTREQARSIARKLSALMPPQVRRGEWNGAAWLANDREGAERYRSTVDEISGRSWKWLADR